MSQNASTSFPKDKQYYKFCLYGFLKNLKFFEPFLILFLLEKGVTYVEIGSLYAIREIGINVLEIPSGFWADAIGRRRTMLTCFFFYILSFLIFYLFSSFLLFAIAMLCFAVGEAFRSGTHKAMIFTYLQMKGIAHLKVHYYGHTRSWSQMGSAVSAIGASLIVFYSGAYRYIFLCSIIPYLLDMLLIWSYPQALDGEKITQEKGKLWFAFKKLLIQFWRSFRQAELFKAINNLSLYTGFYKAVKDYLQPILKNLALSLALFASFAEKERAAILIGIVYFIIHFISSYLSASSGAISERFSSHQKALNWTMLTGGILGLLCGWWYQSGWLLLAVLAFVSIYLLQNLRKPIGVAFIADSIDTRIMASALSAQSQVKTVWAAIFAVALGFMVDMLGIGWALMGVSIALLLLTAILWLRPPARN